MRLTLTAIRLTIHSPAHIAELIPLVWGAKVTKAKPQGVIEETQSHGGDGEDGGRKKGKEISILIKPQTSYIPNQSKY